MNEGMSYEVFELKMPTWSIKRWSLHDKSLVQLEDAIIIFFMFTRLTP